MKTATMMAIALLLISAGSAQAEFYRYVDAHGNVIFTDDLSKVPAQQRAKVQSYEDSLSTTPPAELRKTNEAAARTASQLENERQQLQAREKSLNQEYENLMAERNRLDDRKQEAVTNDQVRSYNEQIVQFNTRIQAYEEKRNAYAADLKTFNERLEAMQSESQKKP